MLAEFLQTNRSELIELCQKKAAARNRAEPIFNADGVPRFISQLIDECRAAEARGVEPPPPAHRSPLSLPTSMRRPHATAPSCAARGSPWTRWCTTTAISARP